MRRNRYFASTYLAPAEETRSTPKETLQNWKVTRVATNFMRDIAEYLLVKSLTRGKSMALP